MCSALYRLNYSLLLVRAVDSGTCSSVYDEHIVTFLFSTFFKTALSVNVKRVYVEVSDD